MLDEYTVYYYWLQKLVDWLMNSLKKLNSDLSNTKLENSTLYYTYNMTWKRNNIMDVAYLLMFFLPVSHWDRKR